MDRGRIVNVKTFTTEAEALVAKGVLESVGITALLIHQEINSVMPMLGELAGIGLAIAAEDEPAAREALCAEFDTRDFERQGE